jgi:hypothetical protein
VQFEYPGGELLFSECRQIDGCLNDVSEHVYGVDGECHLSLSGWSVTGKHPWEHSDAGDPDPYQVEHDDLFASIRNKTPLNEGRMVAESTMTAILGRMATYSGREVEWDKAIASNETWGPKTYAFGDLPVDAVPMPGRH